MASDLPLHGVRVLDFTRVLAGPYATMMLADLGADVVKVERPGKGDDSRGFGPPFVDGVSAYFLSVNRGKRSIALDLRQPGELELARRLAAAADVLVENFRPGVMARLGLGAVELRRANPRLVYCSISAFGQAAGPPPGYDLVMQGLGGIPSISGEPGGMPVKSGVSIADLVAGGNAAQAVLAALLRRERSGQGAFIDVPMLDGQLALLTNVASSWLNAGSEAQRLANAHPNIHPFRTYAVRDGYLNLCLGNDALWHRFTDLLAAEWNGDERFRTNEGRVRHRQELDALLEPILARRSAARWQDLLARRGIPCGPIATIAQALDSATLLRHAHPTGGAAVRTVAQPYAIDALPRGAAAGAPALGAHRDEILRAWLDEGNYDHGLSR